MLLQRTDRLPDGPEWLVELKFDGYRALAIKAVTALCPLDLRDPAP